jgi:probable HAF family extracellular repeat protein
MRRVLVGVSLVLGLVAVAGVSPLPVDVASAKIQSDGGRPRLVDLGTLGGADAEATAINDRGEIVGHSDTADLVRHAFLWRRGRMIDLGSLAGPSGISVANDINNEGEVVGYSTTPEGETHAFLWRDGVMTDLGTLGGPASDATAINDLGEIVGSAAVDEQNLHTFIWRDGEMTDLGSSGGQPLVAAHDINNRSQVLASNWPGSVVWEDGALTPVPPPEGSDFAAALAINDRGMMTGNALAPGTFNDYQVAVWKRGAGVIVGTLGGRYGGGVALNERGHVVGSSETADETWDAFIWRDGRMTALPNLAPEHSAEATDINEDGKVVGWSYSADGHRHAILWK